MSKWLCNSSMVLFFVVTVTRKFLVTVTWIPGHIDTYSGSNWPRNESGPRDPNPGQFWPGSFQSVGIGKIHLESGWLSRLHYLPNFSQSLPCGGVTGIRTNTLLGSRHLDRSALTCRTLTTEKLLKIAMLYRCSNLLYQWYQNTSNYFRQLNKPSKYWLVCLYDTISAAKVRNVKAAETQFL